MKTFMKTLSNVPALLLAAALVLGVSACGEKKATPEHAKAMALKAAAYLEEAGPEKAFDAFTNSPDWKDGDLYVFVSDNDGVLVAHGFNPELVGTNSFDLTDADGKYFIREFIAITDQGWVDYKWKSPTTGEIEDKTSYVVRAGDYVVGVGAYK